MLMHYFKLLVMRSYWYQHLILLISSLFLIMLCYWVFLWNKHSHLAEHQLMLQALQQKLEQINSQLAQLPSQATLTEILATSTTDHYRDNIADQTIILAKESQMMLMLLKRYDERQEPVWLIELRGHYAQFIAFIQRVNQAIDRWRIVQITIIPDDDMLIFSLTLKR
ncbi:hypothetical protein RHO15_03910 [Utexia brackfieldae]|uniref:hypothetical protein n=1 Tax=Utexia brackfieldae TaxID=3074108 RepID=UPI00370DD2C2